MVWCVAESAVGVGVWLRVACGAGFRCRHGWHVVWCKGLRGAGAESVVGCGFAGG